MKRTPRFFSMKLIIGWCIFVFVFTVALGRAFPGHAYWIGGGMIALQIVLALALRPYAKRYYRRARKHQVKRGKYEVSQ